MLLGHGARTQRCKAIGIDKEEEEEEEEEEKEEVEEEEEEDKARILKHVCKV